MSAILDAICLDTPRHEDRHQIVHVPPATPCKTESTRLTMTPFSPSSCGTPSFSPPKLVVDLVSDDDRPEGVAHSIDADAEIEKLEISLFHPKPASTPPSQKHLSDAAIEALLSDGVCAPTTHEYNAARSKGKAKAKAMGNGKARANAKARVLKRPAAVECSIRTMKGMTPEGGHKLCHIFRKRAYSAAWHTVKQ